MRRMVVVPALGACLSFFIAFASPTAQAQSAEELANSAPAQALLKDSLHDNEMLLVGVTENDPYNTHPPSFFANFDLPYAVRLTRIGRVVVYQFAIQAEGEIVNDMSRFWIFDPIASGRPVAFPEARDARIAETPGGDVLVFAPSFLKSPYAEIVNKCVNGQDVPCSFEEATDWAIWQFEIAGDRKILPIDQAIQPKGVVPDHAQAHLRPVEKLGDPKPFDKNWTRKRILDLRETGDLVIGAEAYTAAAQAETQLRERHQLLVASKPERIAIYREAYGALKDVGPNFLLHFTCGRVPTDNVFGLVAHGTTQEAELRAKNAYPACVERVRASLDREAYAAVFAALQPRVEHYAALGGKVEPIEGGTGLQILGQPMPHPDAIELPLDKALATLAGRDFTAFEQDAAYMEAARQRRLERERRQREAEQRAAQALNELNAQILYQQMRQSGAASSQGGVSFSLSAQDSGSASQATGSGERLRPGPLSEDDIAWRRRVREDMERSEARARERMACIDDPGCTPKSSNQPMDAIAQ